MKHYKKIVSAVTALLLVVLLTACVPADIRGNYQLVGLIIDGELQEMNGDYVVAADGANFTMSLNVDSRMVEEAIPGEPGAAIVTQNVMRNIATIRIAAQDGETLYTFDFEWEFISKGDEASRFSRIRVASDHAQDREVWLRRQGIIQLLRHEEEGGRTIQRIYTFQRRV